MSIDQVARRAGADLRTAVSRDLDVDAALAALEGTRRRRRRARFVTAGAVAAAAAAAMLAVVPLPDPRATTPATPHPATAYCLGTKFATCPATDVVQVKATVPYVVHLPKAFVGDPGVGQAPEWVEFYQHTPGVSGSQGGVTVLSGVGPARSTKHLGARQLALWVAGQPFITPTGVEPTSVDGLPAWRVDATLRPGEPRAQSTWCNSIDFECRALLRLESIRPGTRYPWHGDNSDLETGPRRSVVGSYVFVDVPGPQTVAIWSWVAEGNTDAFGINDQLISGIRFDPAG